jgi:2-methylisocitrate lyase-like PEP mutase family enzyme
MSQAETFHALHAGPDILVLPNAWDAASAALMSDAGAHAVATSSAAVAWAHGFADGDLLPRGVLFAAVAECARASKVPLTADIEGGYTDDLAELAEVIRGVAGAGAVGINLEDGTRDPDLHARKIAAARQAAEGAGVDLFINARTDVYLKGIAQGEAAVAESIRRAALYGEAGASGVFVPGARDAAEIRALTAAISLPVNIMALPGLNAAGLQALGVRRLSSATGLFRAAFGPLAKATEAFLRDGDCTALSAAGDGTPNFNKRFG